MCQGTSAGRSSGSTSGKDLSSPIAGQDKNNSRDLKKILLLIASFAIVCACSSNAGVGAKGEADSTKVDTVKVVKADTAAVNDSVKKVK
jgi:hypothetical protein